MDEAVIALQSQTAKDSGLNLMRDPVLEKLEAVHDAETFLAFLEAMLADLPGHEDIAKTSNEDINFSGVRGWMNRDLWSFLEASIAFGKDSKRRHSSQSSAEAWKAAAEILYGGKVYE